MKKISLSIIIVSYGRQNFRRENIIPKLIFSSPFIDGASRGHFCDSTAFLFCFCGFFQSPTADTPTQRVSEWVEFYVPLDVIIGHFGDESFQAVTCTGTGITPAQTFTLNTLSNNLPSLTMMRGCSVINRMTSPEVDRRRYGLSEVDRDADVVTCSIWPPDWCRAVVRYTGNVAGVLLVGSTYSEYTVMPKIY